jgi:hypothetical protein
MIIAKCGLAGAGTQNEALALGGQNISSSTEKYNGTSWSSGPSLINGRTQPAGAGTQASALAIAGYAPFPIGVSSCTEESSTQTFACSWATGGNLISARQRLSAAGTQNAGLAFGGYCAPASLACTEEYDGTSWTAGGALITARQQLAGAGTQNAGLAFGGGSPNGACTEAYNGTSWTAAGAMITARCFLGGEGSQDSALAFGGYLSPVARACTEEFTGPRPYVCIISATFAG